MVKRIAIFASGSGTNAEQIMNYFSKREDVSVELILCNKEGAGVIERAERFEVPVVLFNKQQFVETDNIVNSLKVADIDLVVLAGFLWLVPQNLLDAYKQRIVNIHPALLPKYGGKGMYGMKVHEAVVANKESESGITIHYVDEVYDNGEHIFQAKCTVVESDTPEDVAQKVHQLEYKHFPAVIDEVVTKL